MERRLNRINGRGIEARGKGLLSLSLSLSLSTKSAFKVLLAVFLLIISVVGVSGYTTQDKEDLINSFNINIVESDLNKYISTTYGDELHSISWGAAYLIGSLFKMYNATGDLKYVDLAVNSCKRIMNLRDDKRGVHSRRNANGEYVTMPVWRYVQLMTYKIDSIGVSFTQYMIKNDLYKYCIVDALDTLTYYPDASETTNTESYDDSLFAARTDIVNTAGLIRDDFAAYQAACQGNICNVLLEMVQVLDSSALWSRYNIGYNREQTVEFIKESIESQYSEWDEFNEGGVNYGVYSWPARNETYYRLMWHSRFDKVDTISVNQQMCMGRALVKMSLVTGDERYKIQSNLLAKALKRILYLNYSNNSYQWLYKYQNYAANIPRAEDISHSLAVVEFIRDYYNSQTINGVVFNKSDLDRISNTMMRNIYKGDVAYYKYFYRDSTIEDNSRSLEFDIFEEIDAETIEVKDSTLMPMDGVYDVNSLVDGTMDIVNYKTLYQTNWCRWTVAYWNNYQNYNPKVMEVAYNITGNYGAPEVALSYIISNYDAYKPAKITLSKSSITINTDDEIEITVDSIKMLGNFAYKLYQEGGGVIASGQFGDDFKTYPRDSTIRVSGIRTKSAGDIVFKYWSDNQGILGPSKEVVIPVVGKTLVVEHMEEIPVLTTKDIVIGVNELLSTDDEVALPDCKITFYYSSYETFEYTNNEGIALQLRRTITNTAPIWVIAEKDSFFPDTSFIYPYMWSTISEATGKNNGNHVIRTTIDDFTDNVYITYSDGSRTIYGYKDLYNNSFELEAAGLGTDGALERNVYRNKSLIMWDKGSTYYSAEFASPIQDYDSVSLPAINLFAPSLKYNTTDNMMNFAGLSYRYINDESGDLLYAKFGSVFNVQPTVLIPYTGEQDIDGNLIQVKNNQSISLYNQLIGTIKQPSPIIAYITTNNECAVKNFNIETYSWLPSLIVSQTGNSASNSTVWKDGDTTRVVWENLGTDGKQYVIQKKVYAGGEIAKLDTIEDNAYDVKVKDYRLFTYVKSNSICMKQYADRIPNGFERVIVEGTDSVFAPDIDIKYTLNPYRPTYSTIYAIWTEKKGDEYRIGYREDSIMNLELSPLYASELTTTEITMTESSIYDYVIGKFPVEKMKYDIAGLQQDHYYEVSVITSEKNPHIPQIVKIDGDVIGVVYGGKGEDTTKVMVPKEYYEDGYLSIELERKVGKDARVARVECYEYDEVDLETLTQLGKGNKIKLNEETEKRVVSNIVENGLIAYEVTETGAGEIEVIDITGRVVKQSKVKSIKGINTFNVKELPAGIYFIRTDNTTNKLRKIIKLK